MLLRAGWGPALAAAAGTLLLAFRAPRSPRPWRCFHTVWLKHGAIKLSGFYITSHESLKRKILLKIKAFYC